MNIPFQGSDVFLSYEQREEIKKNIQARVARKNRHEGRSPAQILTLKKGEIIRLQRGLVAQAAYLRNLMAEVKTIEQIDHLPTEYFIDEVANFIKDMEPILRVSLGLDTKENCDARAEVRYQRKRDKQLAAMQQAADEVRRAKDIIHPYEED